MIAGKLYEKSFENHRHHYIGAGAAGADRLMALFYMAVAYFTPVAIWVFFKRYWDVRTFPLVVGMIAYMFISVLRAMARIMTTNGMRDMPWMFYICSALLSGIFEEVGRYVVFRWCIPNHDRWTDCIAYGFGHGGIEVVLMTTPWTNDFIDSMWDGSDFLLTMAFSAAMSVLVFTSVHHTDSKKPLILAIGLHTLFDIIPALYLLDVISLFSVWIIDPLYTFLCGYAAYRVYKKISSYGTGSEPEWELYE